ncbi:SNF2-related protein [Paenibacillus sp. 37]|uniref:SNF2-related protein n=1 Tax=Paenibacillus sp. 37 TaxID=2607911 RepID=UPI00122E4F35|nr:helicase-related protein [Paenibacillus sp. 37]
MEIGMYVRCPVEFEYPEIPRRFAIGRVLRVDGRKKEIKVGFYLPGDSNLMHKAYGIPTEETYSFEQINRCKILPQSPFELLNSSSGGIILSFSHTDFRGFHYYYVQLEGASEIRCMSEGELNVPVTRGDMDVISSFENYEFHNPQWYLHRQVVADSLHTLRNATFGFETLIGSRVFLMEHQIDTIVRAISEDPCRFMLADEVGLGKTIEAAVIMKGLQKRLGQIRMLLIVPESLLYQWRNEMSYKFWTDFEVYDGKAEQLHKSMLLFPLEKVNSRDGQQLLRREWDLCIVDETHRLLTMEAEYDCIYKLSQVVPHLLLLSATPIQSRQVEFLRLVRLLDPQKYSQMTEAQFGQLLEKQDFLRRKVHRMMQDLSDYYEEELADDFKEDLDDIAESLGDSNFQQLVDSIDTRSEDKGLSQVELALAYLGEHYQIERKILRHRRKQIESYLGDRTLYENTYVMKGADEQYHESDAYDALIDYLEFIKEASSGLNVRDYQRWLLSAMFSSPWALEAAIAIRKDVITNKIHGKGDGIGQQFPLQDGEEYYLDSLKANTARWRQATETELKRVKECYDDPELIQGRLMKVMDHILQETVNEKVVIFSSWTETLLPLEKALADHFSINAVRGFYTGMTDKELQSTVDDFQNDPDCRFLLCDPLGGEGRNFQMADRIIHIDIPWNPSELEQRIGRLDRIGRKGNVLSVVMYSEGTIEEQLFQIWRDGLQIFNESLSGIEIAIHDIQSEMTLALNQDLRYGLQNVLPSMNDMLVKMRERVQEERYFDMARQLDRHVQEQLSHLITKFDAGGGVKLAETMMKWANMTGLYGNPIERGQVVIFDQHKAVAKSMVRTLLLLPDNSELLDKAGRVGQIRGTFMREVAVAREKLSFFAPGNSMFDAIVNNAQETDWGRSTALELSHPDLDWEGIVYTWSVSLNPNYLLALDEPLEHLVHSQGYTPLEHFITAETLVPGQDERVSDVLNTLSGTLKKVNHLGKREGNKVKEFMQQFPSDIWSELIRRTSEQSKQKFEQYVAQRVDVSRAEDDFGHRLNAMRAANLYFGQEKHSDAAIGRLSSIYQALLEGLRDPVMRLESMAYVRLVKPNESVL